MVRFFKKSVPDTPVTLSSGQRVAFGTVDGVSGYFRTENDDLQRELLGFIEQMRYGLSECSAEEYFAYREQKKNYQPGTLKKPWREEVSPSRTAMDTSSPTRGQTKPSSPVVVEGERSDIPRVIAPPEEAAKFPTVKTEPPPEFNPTLGKRRPA